MATNFERRRLGKKTNPECSNIRNIGGVKKRFRTTATILDRFQTELWKKKKKKEENSNDQNRSIEYRFFAECVR